MAPNKPNAFSCFMREQKPILEKLHNREIKFEELPLLLNSEWTNMSRDRKDKYSRMANKTTKSKVKLDSRGIPLDKIMDEERNALKEEAVMEKNTVIFMSPVCNENGSGIANLNIYIVSLQIYETLVNGTILPAEIGVVKFNLKKGIISEFHRIIKATSPEGYYRSISEHSMNTHNLFDNMNHAAIKGIVIENQDVAGELKKYLFQDKNENEDEIILFTANSQRMVVKSFLGSDFEKIYSLDLLYMKMYNKSTKSDHIPVSIAEDALNSSAYDYDRFPACFFHQTYLENSCKYCALSEAKRYCYNMCLHMDIKNRFGIEPVEGKHLPKKIERREAFSVLPPQVPGYTTAFSGAITNKSGRRNLNTVQPPKMKEDYVSENMDKLSLISDVTESSNSIGLSYTRGVSDQAPAGINLLRGAWASPSTISSVKTEDVDEFPTLVASSYRQYSEGNPQDELCAKPLGVNKQSSAQPNVGLQGFGRGKFFSKGNN